MTVSANAMSYEQARQQALFLTDKMAYELNLTEQQYEAAYEVNLDYLMSINTRDDLYGTYWTRRNLDLSYILFDWQYTAYCSYLLLSSALLGCWLLALRHLCPLPVSRLLLLRTPSLLAHLSWRTCLAQQPRTLMVPRTYLRSTPSARQPRRHARPSSRRQLR